MKLIEDSKKVSVIRIVLYISNYIYSLYYIEYYYILFIIICNYMYDKYDKNYYYIYEYYYLLYYYMWYYYIYSWIFILTKIPVRSQSHFITVHSGYKISVWFYRSYVFYLLLFLAYNAIKWKLTRKIHGIYTRNTLSCFIDMHSRSRLMIYMIKLYD